MILTYPNNVTLITNPDLHARVARAILTYPNNVTLITNPDLYARVARDAGCVPVMCKFADADIDVPAIQRALAMAEELGLPVVAAFAPPIARGTALLTQDNLWKAYLVEVLGAAHWVSSGSAPVAAVLVDQECWRVTTHPARMVAGRTNDLACALMSTCMCPVWFYRLGDPQAKHFSTYIQGGPVLEDFRLPVSARCYEPPENNKRDLLRVLRDTRYVGRAVGAWFSSPSSYGYVDGEFTRQENDEKMLARAKEDGATARSYAESNIVQPLIYPHPTSAPSDNLRCWDTFLAAFGGL